MNPVETQKSFRKQNSDTLTSKESVLSQFDTVKAQLASFEKTFNKCDEHIKRMGLQNTRPKSNPKKNIKGQLLNPNPKSSVDDLISQLEELKHHLKERQEYLDADLAFLKKETGIDLSSLPLDQKSHARKEPVEDHKEIQRNQEVFKENVKTQQEIIKFKHLLESRGESTKKIGPIVNLSKKSDSLDSLINNNKLLKDQLQLASSLLNKAEVEYKIKSIPLSKPGKSGETAGAQKDKYDSNKKTEKIHRENVKIHQKIVRLKESLKSLGGSTKEFGPIINLNKKSDSLDSLINTNKLLKKQLQSVSSLLNKAEIEPKTMIIYCPKPGTPMQTTPQDLNKKEETKRDDPKNSSQNHVDLQKIVDAQKDEDKQDYPQSRLSPLKIAEYLTNGLLSPNISLLKENQILEYKAWGNIFSHAKLSEIATIYCTFLNTTGGRLLLGVDEDKVTKRGIVQGYKLTPEEIQSLKELLSFKHVKIIPEPPAENYRLTFIPVEGDGKYVVSVEVKPGDSKTYYGRDSGHLSFIQTRVWNESTQQCEEVKIKFHDVERKAEDENDPRVIIDANTGFEFTFDDSFAFKDVAIQNGNPNESKEKDQHLMQLLGAFDKKEPYHALDIWCGLKNIEQLQSACIATLQDLLQDSEKMHCEVEEG